MRFDIMWCDRPNDLGYFFDREALETVMHRINREKIIAVMSAPHSLSIDRICGRWHDARIERDVLSAELKCTDNHAGAILRSLLENGVVLNARPFGECRIVDVFITNFKMSCIYFDN